MAETVYSDAPPARDRELTQFKVVILCSIVFIMALVHLLYFVTAHTMEWTTNQEMPYVLRGLDPGFNPHDFFTNSVENSPRIGFAFVINCLVALGMDWETAFYTMKAAMALVRPLLLFFIVLRLAESMLTTPRARQLLPTVAGVAAIAPTLIYWYDGAYMIAGWDMVFANDALSPMAFAASILLGAILVIVSPPWRGSVLVTGVLMMMAGFIHPVMGLSGWAWISVFLIGLRDKPLNALRESAILLPFALAPALFLQVMYGETGSTLSAEAYRDIYATWRHPWHFDMSYAMNHMRGLPLVGVVFTAAMALAVRAKAWRLVTMLALVISLAVGALVTQYVTTNLMAISLFVNLGPSRAVNLLCLFLFLGFAMAVFAQFQNEGEKGEVARTANGATRLGHSGFWVLGALVFSVPIASYNIAKGAPLPAQKELVSWLQDNTDEADVVAFMDLKPTRTADSGHFEPNVLTSIIRVYAERPVFYDKTFPLRRHASIEFRARHDTARAMVTKDLEELRCAAQPFRLDYVVYGKGNPYTPETAPDFTSGPYTLFKVPPQTGPCPASS